MTGGSPGHLLGRIAGEVDHNPSENVVALERRHLADLHDAGATRDQAVELLERCFPDDEATVAHITADLDSYGPWAGE